MNIVLVVVVVAVIVIYLKFFAGINRLSKDISRPSEAEKPTIERENDKIILVSNASHEVIKNVLTAFCNMYNKDSFAALPRLWQLSSTAFAITFPYDIDFITYCFLVNFLDYPTDIKWNAHVRAWATTKHGDDWIPTESINKKMMLFIAEDDKEYDNVFATTEDNVGYKIGFSGSKAKLPLPDPKEMYKEPGLSLNTLNGLGYEDLS